MTTDNPIDTRDAALALAAAREAMDATAAARALPADIQQAVGKATANFQRELLVSLSGIVESIQAAGARTAAGIEAAGAAQATEIVGAIDHLTRAAAGLNGVAKSAIDAAVAEHMTRLQSQLTAEVNRFMAAQGAELAAASAQMAESRAFAKTVKRRINVVLAITVVTGLTILIAFLFGR